MKYSIIVLSLCFFSISGFCQELDFNIHGSYGKPILKEQLVQAKSMNDINADYPSSWIAVSDYESSEITATCNGVEMKASGENDKLNNAQQKVLKNADVGTSIVIEVKYKVKNSITSIVDVKTMNFSVSRIPETQAKFSGGDEILNQYLKENAIDKINQTTSNKFEYASVKFYIGEDGKSINSELVKSTGDEKIDQILLETIVNMPSWEPAKDANGKYIKQEFEFSVGMMIGC